MGCARSSVIDEGLEDNIVRPHPGQSSPFAKVVTHLLLIVNLTFLRTGSTLV